MAALLSCNAGDGLGSLCVCKGWIWLHEPLGSAVTIKCTLLEWASLPLQRRVEQAWISALDVGGFSYVHGALRSFSWPMSALKWLGYLLPPRVASLPASDASLLLFLSH